MGNILSLEETDSTNSWVKRNVAMLEAPCLVVAMRQTAGRGQRGNSWESEGGKNLTCSALLRPERLEAKQQFGISEAVSLAVCDVLDELGVEAKVKWPNDIYAGDRKICGILIEHSLLGNRIVETVAGIGLNLNQRVFLSGAPNPVSVVQLTGRETEIMKVAEILESKLGHRVSQAENPALLRGEYMTRLWRGDGGYYPFSIRATGEMITARIENIALDGMLTLRHYDGNEGVYAFKEVEFILGE